MFWFIIWIRRTFRAFKVVLLLLRRRDLMSDLPKAYIGDLFRTNRFIQAQVVGIVAFLLMGFSVVLPTEIGATMVLIFFLIGALTLLAKPLRYILLAFKK